MWLRVRKQKQTQNAALVFLQRAVFVFVTISVFTLDKQADV